MAFLSLGERKSFRQKKTNQTAHTEAVSGDVGTWSRISTSKTIYIELTDSDGVTETPTLSNLSFTNTPTGFSYTLGTCTQTTTGIWRQRVNLKKSSNAYAFFTSYTATWNYVKGTTITNTFYYVEDQYSYGYLNGECFVPGNENMVQLCDLSAYITVTNKEFVWDDERGDGAHVVFNIADTYKGPPIHFHFYCYFEGDSSSSTSDTGVYEIGSNSWFIYTDDNISWSSRGMILRAHAKGYKDFYWEYDK